MIVFTLQKTFGTLGRQGHAISCYVISVLLLKSTLYQQRLGMPRRCKVVNLPLPCGVERQPPCILVQPANLPKFACMIH